MFCLDGAVVSLPCPAGISRRSLAILHAVAAVTPDPAAISAALLHPEALAALVRLLGCGAANSQREAAALMLLLLDGGDRDAARRLAAAGAGPALVALSASDCSEDARGLAAQALNSMQVLLGPSWLPAMPVQHPSLAASLQRATSLPGGADSHAVSAGRAASAPAPAGAPHQAGPVAHGSFASMQQWHGPPLSARPGQQSGARSPSPAAGMAANVGQRPPASPTGRTSVAGLLASLGSRSPQAQLVAAEQLGALAICGGRAAAVIAAAGGAEALAVCICESAAGPIDIHDTMTDAFEAALSQGVCTAALRALCALLQHQPTAAAALPPAAAAALRLLLAGPDAQQRQLAATVLAHVQGAGADPLAAGQVGGHGSRVQQPSAVLAGAPQGPAAAGAALPSLDLLPVESLSDLLSELRSSSQTARGQDADRALHSRGLSGGTPWANTPAGAPAVPRLYEHVGESPTGSNDPAGTPLQGSNLNSLPAQVRRQLGQQLQLLQRPPRPPSPHSAGPHSSPLSAAPSWVSGSPHLSAGPGSSTYEPEHAIQHRGGLWGPESGGSVEPAVAAYEGQPGGSRASAGRLASSEAGDGGAQADRGASSGLKLTQSDIVICKASVVRLWLHVKPCRDQRLTSK